MSWLSAAFTTLAGILGLLGLISLGLALRPRPFRQHPAPSQPGKPTPFAVDLPPPVRRHFVETIGETPALVESAVVWGRGSACFHGVWFPLRFKVWYRPGRAYLRRMEMTFFQRPVLRSVDRFLGGIGLIRLGGDEETGPYVDYNQARALWAEAVWTPALFVHHHAIQWEPIDSLTSRLIVPLPKEPAVLVAHFDPTNGRMTHLETNRQTEDGRIEPLRFDLLAWKQFQGLYLPCEVAIAEGESGAPGSYWTLEGIVYNVDVRDQLGEEQEA